MLTECSASAGGGLGHVVGLPPSETALLGAKAKGPGPGPAEDAAEVQRSARFDASSWNGRCSMFSIAIMNSDEQCSAMRSPDFGMNGLVLSQILDWSGCARRTQGCARRCGNCRPGAWHTRKPGSGRLD